MCGCLSDSFTDGNKQNQYLLNLVSFAVSSITICVYIYIYDATKQHLSYLPLLLLFIIITSKSVCALRRVVHVHHVALVVHRPPRLRNTSCAGILH